MNNMGAFTRDTSDLCQYCKYISRFSKLFPRPKDINTDIHYNCSKL